MHLSSWINILCLVAVLNARAVRRKRQSVELSDKILDGKRITWSALSQKMKQIDTGMTRYVWATDKNDDVYLLNEEERSFKPVPGLNLVHVTSGEAGVWGVNADDEIFFRDGIKDDNPMGISWEKVEGGLKQLDSGPKGAICGVNYRSYIYYRKGITETNPTGTGWQKCSGLLDYISCNDYGFWGRNNRNDVYFTTKLQSKTKWTKIGCDHVVQIETGPNGQVWAVSSEGDLYIRIGVNSSSPSGLSWQKIGKEHFKSVAVGLNKVFVVDVNDTVYTGYISSEDSHYPEPSTSKGYVLKNAKINRCLKPESQAAIEGTPIIHSESCRETSALFRILKTGAIQHVQSGLCIHLTGNAECPRRGQAAVLQKNCLDSRYFFKYNSGKGFELKQMCLGPWSFINLKETRVSIYSLCYDLRTTYELIDIIKECDLKCLMNIIRSKNNTSSFEEFYKTSESEAKSLVPESSTFISKLKQEIPQLYMDLFSTFFPVDVNIIKNLELLMHHFGIEKVKSYPSLFLATAFIRRKIGVKSSVEAPCGGTGTTIGGKPVIDEEDAEYKLSLTESELASLLDEEDFKARQAIDKEREKDEKAGINVDKFNISWVQKMIDHLDGKYYYKFWTPESIQAAMKVCTFTDPNEIRFPPRGHGMSGIEYLEYYFSRDPELLPEENLKFPWPLAIALTIQTSLRECNWIWRRMENGEKIVYYSKYTWDYRLNEVQCKASDWNPCSVPRIIEDGGVCGRQSTLARITNHCLGVASGGIKQPAHAAGYTYKKLNNDYTFQVFQGITNMLNTYSEWYLVDDSKKDYTKINAEYHLGLTRAMNHGYESYRNGRNALLIFTRIYDAELRQNSRDLLVEALEGNPHMMDVWMQLINDVTGSEEIPREGQNVVDRVPTKCPHFDDTHRENLEKLLHEYLSSYLQMYLEVLLRLLSPPTCCSVDKPQYMKILATAWNDRKENQNIKGYLFDAYVSCISKSVGIQEILNLIENEVFADTALPQLDSFTALMNTLSSILDTANVRKVEAEKKNLTSFFTRVCDVFPRFHVTASAWVIAPHYRLCTETQLKFLETFVPEQFKIVFEEWTVLHDKSAKSSKIWNKYFLKGWLYGRTGDIVPLLVGVKESVDSGLIRETKVNVARNMSVIMPSQWKDYTSSANAVDGNTDPNVNGGSCAVTAAQNYPWLRIELNEPTKVYGLLISNVEEKFRDNLNKFEIHIGNSIENEGLVNPTCGNLHSMPRGETRAFYCDPPLVGEYITINIPKSSQVLALCEVEVYASELASYRSNGVKLDIWYNIKSKHIEKLYDDPRYPENPDYTLELSTFDYYRLSNQYGSRLSAVYEPQESGNYTFYAACTDECEVFLRHGETGGTLQKIISLKTATDYKDWSASDKQKSSSVFLEKGNFYELIATLKEYTGNDYITLAVKMPSGEFLPPIPSEQLFIDTKEESMEVMA